MDWVCGVCGYVEEDQSPPDTCPVCGAPQGRFQERYEDDSAEGDLAGNNREQSEMDEFESDLFADYDE